MGTGSVDRVIKDDIHKIFQEYGIFGVRSKTLLQENLENALEELIHDVLKAQKEEIKFDNKFLVGAYLDERGEAKLTLNHYNCDGDLTDNYVDVSLDIAIKKAQNHLKECDADDSE